MNDDMRSLTAVVLSVLCICCGDSTPTEPSGPLVVTRLGPANASFTYTSAFTTPQRLLVRDASAWQQTWAAIWANSGAAPPLPAVDFSREMVIVAALGQRPTGGFSIFVDDAQAADGGLRIAIRSVSPGPGCGVTLAVTAPVDVARVTRRDGRATYEEVSETRDCR